ncbi:RNA-binding protein MEX3B [Portunus trituberculatus]|uniref:RNA-binding protein MEX3B n=1 Tax=Portunus trituberculatus TaxID=210409 RepID=A0A5B7EXJ5_PORTR|nr:RNA-binding protein MEX3B [Portunus trituberculatus]
MERPTPTPSSTSAMDEQRALQLALELSLIGLNNESSVPTSEPEHYVVQGLDAERASTKRSQNMTECVAVPSSEHVAEIVGRQDCVSMVTSGMGWAFHDKSLGFREGVGCEAGLQDMRRRGRRNSGRGHQLWPARILS